MRYNGLVLIGSADSFVFKLRLRKNIVQALLILAACACFLTTYCHLSIFSEMSIFDKLAMLLFCKIL